MSLLTGSTKRFDNCAAIPVAAYLINTPTDVFVIAAFVSLAIALLTVSVRTIQAALANPIKAIKAE